MVYFCWPLTLGWDEAGIDTICLWSGSPISQSKNYLDPNMFGLIDILPVYMFAGSSVVTPFGILINAEQKAQIEKNM